ncbi:MAG: DUF4382 domain-containing protein [Saprospiraceae bacterium]
MKKLLFVGVPLLVVLAIAACSKDDTTTLSIRLTDGPGDFQQVNVDVQEVLVKTSGDTSKWLTLSAVPGVYDLLKLQNGVDTLIAVGSLPTVVLKEVRLILGTNNTVMVDSVMHNLDTPSADQSGLKIKVDKKLAATLDNLVLDFDAEKSIVKKGDGTYSLKPVIKVKN